MLVQEFILKTCREMGMEPMEIDPFALAYLARQSWPGNLRELLNFVRRLAVFSNGKTIELALINLVEGKLDKTPCLKGIRFIKMQKKRCWIFFQRII